MEKKFNNQKKFKKKKLKLWKIIILFKQIKTLMKFNKESILVLLAINLK